MTEQTEMVVDAVQRSARLLKALVVVVVLFGMVTLSGFIANRASIDAQDERLEHLERRLDIVSRQAAP